MDEKSPLERVLRLRRDERMNNDNDWNKRTIKLQKDIDEVLKKIGQMDSVWRKVLGFELLIYCIREALRPNSSIADLPKYFDDCFEFELEERGV